MTNPHKLVLVFFVLTIIGSGAAGYFYLEYQNSQKQIQQLTSDPNLFQKADGQESQRIAAEVNSLIALPGGDTPTVSTISHSDKIQDQPFFQKAKDGDKLLIYPTSKKAVLYDPQAKRVLDIATISISTSSAQVTPNQTPKTQPKTAPKVVLLNGTSTVGLTVRTESTLKKEFTDLNVIDKDNAEGTYPTTTVVVFNDVYKEYGQKLATSLKAKVGELPKVENKPQGADIVVILGKDNS